MTVYLLAGGGTAGHVNPMLAIAREIRTRQADAEIIVVGTSEGLEARLVPEAGFEFEVIPRLPFPRFPNRRAVAFLKGWRSSVRRLSDLIRSRHVNVVVGVGGYVAAPAYAAARACGIPLVIHEANARPGLANRWAASFATRVGVAIPGTRLRGARFVGMPLRPEIAHADIRKRQGPARDSFGLSRSRPVLLVTGGSLGARRINRAFAESADAILASGWQILQVTGMRDAGSVPPAGRGHVVLDYCDRMADALCAATAVLSRAGSSTVAEISALGLPAIYVPYASGNGEQLLNAKPAARAGAAIIVRDAALTPQWVRSSLPAILNNDAHIAAMAEAAHRAGTRDGARLTVDLIIEALGQTPENAT